MSEPVKRPYDSSRRQEQARATRRAVLETARDLFIERGYGRTTVKDIAVQAGVSAELIYAAFGNKPTLLHRAWDITIGGDDDEILFHERPEVRALIAEPNLAGRLQMQAVLLTATAHRVAPFTRALLGAAGSEQAAADMLREINRQRLIGIGVMAKHAAATGQLAVPEEECRDVVWATT
ncbi:MAG: regulatory protein TetR, partial [Frankiales bacterium]|nr:regulatory protein TetR [Frankiales bacterium]